MQPEPKAVQDSEQKYFEQQVVLLQKCRLHFKKKPNIRFN